MIFSKDRPAQLELLLRSMKKYFVEWNKVKTSILYKYSNEDYCRGYEKTKLYHHEFLYVLEEHGKFKEQTISLINPDNQATMFMVDDLVFKNYFMLRSTPIRKFLTDTNILCVAIRMCPRINYCYTEKRNTPPPKFSDDLIWFWKDPLLKGDWSYPMSLDANLFRTEDILPLLKSLSYENPNTLEGTLASHPIDKPYMICYKDSIVFNIPVNKVQTANGNHCGNIPADYLNKEFFKYRHISISNLEFFKNTACHQEVPLIMEDSIEYTPVKLIDIISKNKINYSSIMSDNRFYKNIKNEISDITLLIPIKDRIDFLKPSVHYMKEAQKKIAYKIKVIYIENDNISNFKEICAKLEVDYIYIPIDICQSNGFFAKSLCYNIGFLLAPKTPWYIFHDLDILVDNDFFIKLNFYIQRNPKWVQPYTQKRVRRLSNTITKAICSNNYFNLSELSDKEAAPANPGSTGGSILVRRDMIERVGGYDPELFYGYAPEDSFFWTKLETETAGGLGPISSCFQGCGLYADDPIIEVYHMDHPHYELKNPRHAAMRRILTSFWKYESIDKTRLIEFKNLLFKEFEL